MDKKNQKKILKIVTSFFFFDINNKMDLGSGVRHQFSQNIHLCRNLIKLTREMVKKPELTYSNEELTEGFFRGDHEVFRYVSDQAIPYLVRNMGKGSSRTLAEEVVQDACIVIYRQANSRDLQLNCKFLTYFIAVCRNIWNYNNQLRGKGEVWKEDLVSNVSVDDEEIGMLWMESREFKLYRKYVNKLKEKQKAILISSLDGIPYRDLYLQFGFSSVDAYKTELFRIRKKLLERIQDDPEFKTLINRTFWSYDE
jgi:DNA-directed RNA polymerase specialized sigma24 family protein